MITTELPQAKGHPEMPGADLPGFRLCGTAGAQRDLSPHRRRRKTMRSHPLAMRYLRVISLPSFTIAFTKTIMPVSCIVYLSKISRRRQKGTLVKQDFKIFI